MGVYVNEYRDAFAPPDYAELFPTPPTVGVLGEVEIELARQDEKCSLNKSPAELRTRLLQLAAAALRQVIAIDKSGGGQ